MLAGLLGMLLVRRERFFARVGEAPDGGGTVLSLASLTRGSGDAGPRFAAQTGGLRAALAARGLATDRLPRGNKYEFATAVVLVAVAAVTVLAVRAPGLRHIGAFVMGPAVLALVLIGLELYTDAKPLVAALRSYWLAIHVTTAFLGFGIFFVSGIASVLYLLRSRYEAKEAAGEAPAGSGFRVVERLPAAASLDRVAHRTAVFGFPSWTFAVIAGAIWAESAWGRFWGWDPKETWAFIAWVVYAGYLHARTTAGWRGRPAAGVSVGGLVVLFF